MESNIKLELKGLNPQELAKVQQTIHTLFERDVFFMRNGKVVLHFDQESTLQEIEFNYKRWKRRKS